MSAKLLGVAFEARMENQARKLVLLKLVDCADDDGRHIFPSNQTIARQAEVAVRTVQRVTNEFVCAGLLLLIKGEDKSTRLRTNEYAINLDLLYELAQKGWSGVFATDESGEKETESTPENASVEGDRESPLDNPADVATNAASVTSGVTLTPLKGDTACHPTPYEPSDNPNPEYNSGVARADSDGEGDADYSFERFRDDYPKPDDGLWRIWGDVGRNIWPFLDLADRKQAIECLPTYRKEIRTGKTRLCNPKTFLKEARFVDIHAETTRPKHQDKTFVADHEPIWSALEARYCRVLNKPDCPKMDTRRGRGWSFENGWIMQAKRELETAKPASEPVAPDDYDPFEDSQIPKTGTGPP